MVIRRKSSIDKKYYELSGQMSFFGRDRLDFKSVTLQQPQKYKNLCRKFRLKMIIKNKKILLPIIDIH
tara:strand:+ start:448 stop:651 length:204 start_codon:yes stop_codon:yes gene_type:complete